MSKATVMTLPRLVIDRLAHRSATMNVLLVVGASILLALSAQVQIPMVPVPFTLQPLAVLLIGAALGSTRGAAAVALYLTEGAAGLPVFAGGAAGPAVLVGPTAGYLFGFVAAAFIAGFFSERAWNRSLAGTVLGMALAIGVIHLGGWSWLAAAWHLGAAKAFTVGVAPFLAGDLVKLAIAATILPFAQKTVEKLA